MGNFDKSIQFIKFVIKLLWHMVVCFGMVKMQQQQINSVM